MEKNTYSVNLINSQGCNFDNNEFDSLEKAKEWAKGRGSKRNGYYAHIKVNYDPETNVSEEEINIDYK